MILVTGSTGTLGSAISRRLSSSGVKIALQYHSNKDRAQSLATELAGSGAEAFALEANLSLEGEASRLVREAAERMGGLNLLVHAASTFDKTPLGTVTEEQWDRIMAVDLKSAFFLAQEAGLMMQRGGGRMIFLSDVAAQRPYAGYLPYCAAKAGVDALVRGLAKSLAPKVQVNGVAPYLVTRPEWLSDKGWADLLSKMPMRKASEPDEIASVVEMIAKSGDSITGQVIAIDGGRLLR